MQWPTTTRHSSQGDAPKKPSETLMPKPMPLSPSTNSLSTTSRAAPDAAGPMRCLKSSTHAWSASKLPKCACTRARPTSLTSAW